MKKYFNKTQVEKLRPYENHFHTVIYAKYKRATTYAVNLLVASIYEETTGEQLTKNFSCSQCVFNVFEKCGRLYYESVKILNEKNAKSNNTGDKKCNRKSTNKTNKSGRSKQNNS